MLLANLSNEIPFPLQPVYSPSVLIEMMRPDGSSTIPVLNGDSLSADLAHELMGIQVKMILRFLNCVVLLLVLWAIPNN
jgi:protein SMG9